MSEKDAPVKQINSRLIEALPQIARYKDSFVAANKRLSRTALTGKISSLSDAATLFEFIETTQLNFAALQGRLIDYLLDESLKKATLEASSLAAAAIDILVRNLYERSADVGFLATDAELAKFLENPEPSEAQREAIRARLKDYAHKYTVYSEIVLLRPNGKIEIAASKIAEGEISSDPIVSKALKSDAYVQAFADSDLTKSRALEFARKMGRDAARPIGVLVLVFNLQDELKRIFDSLGGFLAFVDRGGTVIASNETFVKAGDAYQERSNAIRRFGTSNFVAASAVSKGYEGYAELDWSAVCFAPLNDESKTARKDEAIDENLASILSKPLRDIVRESESIGEDLGDVVINGELIASRSRAYALNPVLENIRQIGEEIREVFLRVQNDLTRTVAASLFSETKTLAKLGLDVLSRNLYERSNDCRWWSLTRVFREANFAEAAKTLEYINKLYTTYAALYIYDAEGVTRAVSKKEAARFIGQKSGDRAGARALQNDDLAQFFVSPFAPNEFYGGKPTYVYHASILSEKLERVGGIGIVFDAEPQFKAILKAALPRDSNGEIKEGAFNLFISDGVVLSSTNAKIKPLDASPFNLSEFAQNDAVLRDYDGRKYVVALFSANGYREYSHPYALQSLLFAPA